MTQAEMLKEIETLRAQNEALKARVEASKKTVITLKVSPKGGLSLYGMGRWPVTLYQEQWLKILDRSEEIRAFIKTNADALTKKQAA